MKWFLTGMFELTFQLPFQYLIIETNKDIAV